jgi:hypothetical protein
MGKIRIACKSKVDKCEGKKQAQLGEKYLKGS